MASPYPRLGITINANARRIRDVMETCIRQSINGITCRLKEGTLTLVLDSEMMRIDGRHTYPYNETIECIQSVPRVIEIQLVNRPFKDVTDLWAQCNQPVALPYYTELVSELGKRWPKVKGKIAEHIAKLNIAPVATLQRTTDDLWLEPDLRFFLPKSAPEYYRWLCEIAGINNYTVDQEEDGSVVLSWAPQPFMKLGTGPHQKDGVGGIIVTVHCCEVLWRKQFEAWVGASVAWGFGAAGGGQPQVTDQQVIAGPNQEIADSALVHPERKRRGAPTLLEQDKLDREEKRNKVRKFCNLVYVQGIPKPSAAGSTGASIKSLKRWLGSLFTDEEREQLLRQVGAPSDQLGEEKENKGK